MSLMDFVTDCILELILQSYELLSFLVYIVKLYLYLISPAGLISTLLLYFLPRSTDMLWERHINCQNVKVFGQANGTLKIFKLLPYLPGLPWKHKWRN